MKTILLSIVMIVSSISIGQVVTTYPYNEDFEDEGASTSCSGYVMLDPQWNNDLADDGNDWNPDAGGTGSTGTGPAVDFNPGTGAGKYMYTETSGCSNDIRNLESPWFDFTGTTGGLEMTFAYHMLGATMGDLSVEARTGTTDAWTEVLAPFTDNMNLWQIASVDLTSFAAEDSVQVRFVAATGTSFTSDMAIDDVTVVDGIPMTGGISSIIGETCFNSSNGSITIDVNFGAEPLTYSWDTGDPADTLATLSDVGPGTYCCTVTDGGGSILVDCGDIIALATDSLFAYTHAVDEWICTDSTGLIVIDSITGGAALSGGGVCGISSLSCTGPVDTLQVGTEDFTVGGTTYPSPLGNWYWGTRHQMLITAAELTAAGIMPGNLSGLSMNIDALGTADPNLTGLTIKIGCTTATDMTVWDDAGPVEVYPATDVTIATGWNWFDFADAFYWNGIDNIIVETCFNNAGFTNNPQTWCTTTAFTSVIYYRADSPTVCGTSATTGTSANRPVIRFENCEAVSGYPYIYSWDVGSSADTTAVPGGTYYFTVEDGTGCIVTDSVTVNESAPVNIDDVTICETNPTDFSASSTFDSYTWSTSETGQTISITTGGTYYVDAVDSLGCPTSDTAFVSTLPVPVISATSSDEMFGSDGYIDLLVYGSAFPFTIDWDNDGTGDDDDTEDQFGLDPGDYTVVVTDTNGCYATLTITVNSQLGLDDYITSTFKIYPNPTKDVVYVQPVDVNGDHVYGEVLDLTGRVVKRFTIFGSNTATVDMSTEERGTYFVRMTVDGEQSTAKLVIQ